MQVTYTNRKGQVFFLCKGTTKTRKTRYLLFPADTIRLVRELARLAGDQHSNPESAARGDGLGPWT